MEIKWGNFWPSGLAGRGAGRCLWDGTKHLLQGSGDFLLLVRSDPVEEGQGEGTACRWIRSLALQGKR